MKVPAVHYLPPPAVCEKMADMVARCGGSVEDRGSEVAVNYVLPLSASEEVRKFLRPQSAGVFPAGFVAQVANGRVFGSGNVLSPDGRSLARDVSPDFGKPFDDHWLLTYKKIRPPALLRGSVAVIATTLGVGYSHWLLEELPRLLALRTTEFATLIAHTGACLREALALHGFSGAVVPARRFAHVTCEELIVPSLSHLIPPTVCAIEEFTAPLSAARSEFGERLYLSRAKARRRRVTNEAELCAQLGTCGFTKVYLEDLTWAQQIAAFRAARVIVAPHGAGLANLVFCRPGTRVIELFHPSYVNGCFWQLSALKELDYSLIVESSAEPLAQRLRSNRCDIKADVTQVLRSLRG